MAEKKGAKPEKSESDLRKSDDNRLVGVADLALWLGCTDMRARQLIRDGALVPMIRTPAYKFRLRDTINGYIKYLSDKCLAESRKAKGRRAASDPDGDMLRKLKADADLKECKAETARLELSELQGKLHRSEDVEAMTTDLVFAVRAALIAMPGRLAMDTARITDANEESARIRQECNAVLESLTAYQYDPAAYAERVRNRLGWDAAARLEEDAETEADDDGDDS